MTFPSFQFSSSLSKVIHKLNSLEHKRKLLQVNGSDSKLEYYQKVAQSEAEWLWSQQLSNGAFAFYNQNNGQIFINPYFSEVVALALINYDHSKSAKAKIEKYFDWHFSHLNSKTEDYNHLEGTIYDYNANVTNGIVISEKSKNVYDSTDSYAALFLAALAEYMTNYGIESTKTYIINHKKLILQIINVIFATQSQNGYTFAKPDYKVIYLMDNCEVFAGLKSALYIIQNLFSTETDILNKLKESVLFYEENFDNDWWKKDHYASILKSDKSEYTGIAFSYQTLYPCATAQMFPFLYKVIDPFTNEHSEIVYSNFAANWKWEEMDYITKGITTFYWGNFALFAARFKDDKRLNKYLEKYQKVVDGGRKYPLYSSESAMVLLAVNQRIKDLNDFI